MGNVVRLSGDAKDYRESLLADWEQIRGLIDEGKIEGFAVSTATIGGGTIVLFNIQDEGSVGDKVLAGLLKVQKAVIDEMDNWQE